MIFIRLTSPRTAHIVIFMKRLIFAFLLIFACLSTTIESANAQEKNYCNTCFRGKPKPNCCSFFIFESGWMFNLARAGEPQGKASFIFTADLGMMFNNNNRKAWGGSFHLAADDDGTRFGIGPRYRSWLSKTVAFDLSPKLMFGGGSNYEVHRRFPGFVMSASITLSDLISFDSYFQIIPYYMTTYNYINPIGPPIPSLVKDTETGLYLGISGRSYLAPVLPIALGIAVAVAFSNWD